ncbi:hypothetical protein FXO37_06225 [Capsicum annuum]|nr:hypothetical protein FXO37_06225 [Capsicum annuum]
MNDLLADSSFVEGKDNASKEFDIEMGHRFTRSQSDSGIDSFNKQIQEIEKQVDKLSGLLKTLKDANEETKTVTKASAMKGRINALTKKFRDVMTEFQTINNLIETGNSEQIFQNAIQGMGRGQILSTVEEIQERHDAVKEIERKLLDLHQIYLDMAVLVEAQGDLLDNIETQVTNTVDYVQSGTTALQTAKKLQKGSRKCLCIGIILLLFIAAIIVIPIVLKQPWKSNKAA